MFCMLGTMILNLYLVILFLKHNKKLGGQLELRLSVYIH